MLSFNEDLHRLRPLAVTGFSVLLALWLAIGDLIPTEPTGGDVVVNLLLRALDGIGTAGRAGLLTVAALWVGGAIHRLPIDEVWSWLLGGNYEATAETLRVVERKEERAELDCLDPSSDEIREVRRLVGEFQSRVAGSLSMLVLAAVAGLRGGGAVSVAAIALALLLGLEASIIRGRSLPRVVER